MTCSGGKKKEKRNSISIRSCRADVEAIKPRLRLLRAGGPSALVSHTQAISFLALPRPATSAEAPGGDGSPASLGRPCDVHCPFSVLPKATSLFQMKDRPITMVIGDHQPAHNPRQISLMTQTVTKMVGSFSSQCKLSHSHSLKGF